MSTARQETRRLAELLRREHHALAEFLVALSVFDRERRWVELGHSSLFYFLTRELGLPKGPAYYRKTAAELIQKYPEMVEPLRDGRLNLSTVVEVSNVITPENAAEVLPRFFGASKREAKEVVAEIRPVAAPPQRSVVTPVRRPDSALTLPAAAPGAVDGSAPPERTGGLTDAAGRGRPCVVTERAVLPEEPTACRPFVPDVVTRPRAGAERATVEPLTAELTRLHVTVSRRLLAKLAAARDALSHSHPGAADDVILELGLDLIIDRHRKRRGIGAKPRNGALVVAPAAEARADDPPAAPRGVAPPTPHPPPPPPKRHHVPAAVWRAVWERDHGRCVWPLEGGGVCGSTTRLQLDHVDGVALGAETSVARCRLLCAWHNDLHARELYGDAAMNPFTRRKGGGHCSETVAVYAAPTPRPRLHRSARSRWRRVA